MFFFHLAQVVGSWHNFINQKVEIKRAIQERHTKDSEGVINDDIKETWISPIFKECRKSLLQELRQLKDSEWLKPTNEYTPGYNDPQYERFKRSNA